MLFLAPALTAGAISTERERGTLEHLFLTPQRTTAIVIGKFLGALSQLLLVLLSGLPVVAIVYFYGGVSPMEVVKGYLTILLVSFFYASLGFLASCLFKRITSATTWAYGFMLMHVCLLPVVLILVFTLLVPDLDEGFLIHIAGPIEHMLAYIPLEHGDNGIYFWQGAVSTLVQICLVLGGCVLLLRHMRGNSPMRLGRLKPSKTPAEPGVV